MSAHTPGPWRFYGDEIVRHINGSLGDPTVCSLVGTSGNPYAENENEFMADASLIAAAPDLLSALQSVQAAWDENRLLTSDEAASVRAAIAKATGGQL
jgi:hypothetical protein